MYAGGQFVVITCAQLRLLFPPTPVYKVLRITPCVKGVYLTLNVEHPAIWSQIVPTVFSGPSESTTCLLDLLPRLIERRHLARFRPPDRERLS